MPHKNVVNVGPNCNPKCHEWKPVAMVYLSTRKSSDDGGWSVICEWKRAVFFPVKSLISQDDFHCHPGLLKTKGWSIKLMTSWYGSLIIIKYAMSVISFELFGLNISPGVGGYKTHELLLSGDRCAAVTLSILSISAEMIVIALQIIFNRNSSRFSSWQKRNNQFINVCSQTSFAYLRSWGSPDTSLALQCNILLLLNGHSTRSPSPHTVTYFLHLKCLVLKQELCRFSASAVSLQFW